MRLISQGIHYEAWSPDELEQFSRTLGSLDRREALIENLRRERAWINSFDHPEVPLPSHLEKVTMRAGGNPFAIRENFAYMHLIQLNQAFTELIEILSQEPPIPLREEFFAKEFDPESLGWLRDALRRSGVVNSLVPVEITFFLALDQPEDWLRIYPGWCVNQQVRVDMTILACAVERYRFSEGALPASLEDLTPDWLEQLPPDICTGDSYYYQVLPENGFMLWSHGYRNPPPVDFNPDLYLDRAHEALMFLRD